MKRMKNEERKMKNRMKKRKVAQWTDNPENNLFCEKKNNMNRILNKRSIFAA